MDGIPEKMIEAHKKAGAARNKAFQFSACFDFPADGALSDELIGDLDLLYEAYLSAARRLYFRRKRRKISYDFDLTRILWPRFAVDYDADGFDRVHSFCKHFFDSLNKAQKDAIRTAFQKPVSFEQTRQDRERKLMESLHTVADFRPEQEEEWETLREQFLDFRQNGFCLPYLMLALSVRRKAERPNPYRKELEACKTREALLEKVLDLAKISCRRAFPECGGQSLFTPLAAHLAAYADCGSGKESFFWMLLGEKTALSYLHE